MDVSKLVINKLFKDELYARKYVLYINKDYFEEDEKRDIVEIYLKYFREYDNIPSEDDMILLINNFQKYDNFKDRDEKIENIEKVFDECFNYNKKIDIRLLNLETQKFIKDSKLEEAIHKTIDLYEEKDKDDSRDNVKKCAEFINEAVGLTFDEDLGLDFDDLSRFDIKEQGGEKIPFYDCNTLNMLTRGGAERKSINIIAMGTNGGKTRFLTWLAQGYVKQGYNVLYVTMEMPEWKIYRYIDASYFEIDIDTNNKKDVIEKKKKIISERKKNKEKNGSLKVKKYPSRTITALEIRNFINKVRLQKKIDYDIVIVDYLQIMLSYKTNNLSLDKTHQIYGEVTIELRNIAEEYNCMVWTGSQFNRDGANSNDFSTYKLKGSTDIDNNSDFILGGYSSNDDLENNIVQMGTIKTRYNKKSEMNEFTLGINEPEMRYYDIGKYKEMYDWKEEGFDDKKENGKEKMKRLFIRNKRKRKEEKECEQYDFENIEEDEFMGF